MQMVGVFNWNRKQMDALNLHKRHAALMTYGTC
jgi:hypothetical protein